MSTPPLTGPGRPRGGLSGSALKGLALASMTVDHAAAVLLWGGLFAGGAAYTAAQAQVYLICRGAGRLAFPVYCFLLAEGLAHTANRRAYAGRLAAFALLSEIPFDLAFAGRLFDPSAQNVFWTLLLSFLAAWASEWPERAGVPAGRPARTVQILGWVLPLLCVFGAEALRTDYGGFGVLLILLFSKGRDHRPAQLLAAAALIAAICWMDRNWLELYALLALIPLGLYSGQKGRGGPKYLFYLYYPLHLLALSLLRFLWLGR